MDDDPEFQQCDSGQLSFNNELAFHTSSGETVNITRYEQLSGHYTALRPVYRALVPRHSSTTMYLFHYDGVWRLGTNYTRSVWFQFIHTGWSKKTDTLCFVRLNFIKYWPIFKLISLPELREKFVIILSLKIPPHLKCVATLPCLKSSYN